MILIFFVGMFQTRVLIDILTTEHNYYVTHANSNMDLLIRIFGLLCTLVVVETVSLSVSIKILHHIYPHNRSLHHRIIIDTCTLLRRWTVSSSLDK